LKLHNINNLFSGARQGQGALCRCNYIIAANITPFDNPNYGDVVPQTDAIAQEINTFITSCLRLNIQDLTYFCFSLGCIVNAKIGRLNNGQLPLVVCTYVVVIVNG